jgi:hypothetical protein
MGLTLEQLFEKRKMTDVAQSLSETQLLANLKHANALLKRKTITLDSFLQTGEFKFVEDNDPSFAFGQVIAEREFAQYNREQLIDGLLLTLEALMHIDNQFRESF